MARASWAGSPVIQAIVIGIPTERVKARARLLWDVAPRTCQAIVDCLPMAGRAHHAIYSGSEIALILPTFFEVEPENATTEVATGDLAFTYMRAGSHHGVNADFSELCWFYDDDARPSMWEGPVPVSVFARIEAGTEFYRVCREMRLTGAKEVEVRVG